VQIFVGTSGWLYSWNEAGTLDWYLENSRLNAIELNASFYRFPFPNQIKSWANKGKNLRWAIKVNRLITHQFKFGEKAKTLWERFQRLFSPMEKMIDFYLFQLPPNFSPKARKKLECFIRWTKLKSQFALEVRHIDWFSQENYLWAKEEGIIWVSIDAPDLPRDIIKTNDTIYLRIHGRTGWYAHNYSSSELKEIAQRILSLKPERVFIFFNNDHAMLKNARMMKKIINLSLTDQF